MNTSLHFCVSEKHGPCSAPVVRDEYDYFVTALNLYFKYNVTVRLCFFHQTFLLCAHILFYKSIKTIKEC